MIDDAKTHPLCLLCVCLWKSHELSVDYMLHTRDTAAVVRFFNFFSQAGFLFFVSRRAVGTDEKSLGGV